MTILINHMLEMRHTIETLRQRYVYKDDQKSSMSHSHSVSAARKQDHATEDIFSPTL